MARGDLQVNNFVKGLHTESSPINFPAGASLDETNFVLRRDGTRDKRLGLDMEPGGVMTTTNLPENILAAARVQHYRWSTPNGNPNLDIGVVQIGSKIFFINLYNDAVSSTILNGGNGVVIGTRNDALMSFATINNYLIMVSEANNDPVLFSYNESTDTITTETAPIMVRDIWGVDDSLTSDGRPVTLSDLHKYNLRNQGWTEDIVSTCGTDAIDCTFSTLGVYPSNSDHWSSGRIENLTDPNVFKYDPSLYVKVAVNTGLQARGHYIIPLYSRGAGRFSNTGLTLPTDAEQGRITTIAAHQGRMFYSGILSNINSGDSRSPNLGGAILFSQTFVNKGDLVNCYTVADPTNIEINDIIDTDGGIINIPDASLILKLHSSLSGLYVFAVNGVWVISSDSQGFRATGYSIRRITNIGLLAKHSVVEAGGTLFYWAEGGIYSITPQNDAGGTTYDVVSITEPTIQKMYNSFPDVFKRNARGFYDAPANKARWLMYSPNTRVDGDPIEGEYIPNLVPEIILGVEKFVITNSRYPQVVYMGNDLALSAAAGISHDLKMVKMDINGNDVTTTVQADLKAADGFLLGFQIFKYSETKAIVFYLQSNSTSTKYKVINISGGVLTYSTEKSLGVTFLNPPGHITNWIDVSMYSLDRLLIVGTGASGLGGIVSTYIFNTGTDTLTLGTSITIKAAQSFRYPVLTKLTSDRYVLTYGLGDPFITMQASVIDISGDVPTYSGNDLLTMRTDTNAAHPEITAGGLEIESIQRVSDTSFDVLGFGSGSIPSQGVSNKQMMGIARYNYTPGDPTKYTFIRSNYFVTTEQSALHNLSTYRTILANPMYTVDYTTGNILIYRNIDLEERVIKTPITDFVTFLSKNCSSDISDTKKIIAYYKIEGASSNVYGNIINIVN